MKGFVYGIYSPNLNKWYIGSTINSVKSRVSVHKSNYRQWLRIGGYCCYSREIFRDIDWTWKVLEEVKYRTHGFLRERERYWMGVKDCVNNNTGIPDMKVYHKRYRDNKKEEMVHCECGQDIAYYSVHSHKKSKKCDKG